MSLLALILLSATPCKDAVFWKSDAILPLVVVRDGKIEPDRGQCASPLRSTSLGDTKVEGGGNVDFHPDGERWRAIDRWGKIVGTVANVNTPKAGMGFKTVAGSRGTGVFVRGAVPTFKSASWSPDLATRRSLVEAVGPKIAKEAIDVAFFQTESGKELSVVAGKTSLVVMSHVGGHWKRVYRTANPDAGWALYRLKAIVDMNDDGMPEIVYHFAESEDGRGHEVVIGAAGKKARWREIANNEDSGS